jgi:PAS domain S-box-containing protein
LLVEDSEDDAELVIRVLRRGGTELTYQRIETREAMEAALQTERWDIVIADYSMPHFSGLAALQLLREKEPDLPFILISGTVGEEVAVKAMQAGAQDYVLKDNLTRLQHAVEREQREAEVRRERRSAEARYRSLFNRVPVGVFSTTPEGRIVEVNPAFVEMLGFPDAEQLKRVNISDLWVRPDERDRLVAEVEHDGAVRNFEMQFRRNDGNTLWCAQSAAAIYDRDGKVERFEAVAVDITEHRRVEQEISHARDQALETARQRSEFLTRMSHEIRTPLNAIIGTTELQLMASDLPPDQRRRTEIVQSGGELLLTIVDDILDFSKLSAGKLALEKANFNLVQVVEATVDAFAATVHAKGIELALYFDPTLPAGLRGDGNRLRQVLNNLLSNAIKFTAEGEVLMRVSRVEETASDVAVLFEVKDTGIGIAPEVQRQLFQPFVQADESTTRRFGGTGLGLVITAQLIEQMGGRIEIESALEEGSNFHFALRLQKGAEIPTPWTANTARFVGLRVLIVDDSAACRAVIADYLTSWGIANVALRNGATALNELRLAPERGITYNAVLLDEGLPGTSGLSLARIIKKDPRITAPSVIMMSAEANASNSAPTVDSWLTKPVLPTQLFECLDLVLLQRAPDRAIAQPDLPADNPQQEWRRKVHVLVVEDNLTNQTLAREQLAVLGFTAQVTEDAPGALEALSNEPYDIVLMDCELPGMDGYAATAEIRRREGNGPHTIVIALTAHANQGQRERCLAAGMNGYLSKPVKLQKLAETLDEAARTKGIAEPKPQSRQSEKQNLEELDLAAQ